MARHFPYCPEDHKAQVLQRLIARDWTKKTRIVAALSIVVHNYIRHNLTDYEGLIRKGGLTRKEARLIAQPELDEWYEYWHSGHDPLKPEPSVTPG